MLKIDNILFPCDLSQNASKVFTYVMSISEKYDSTIYIMHVVRDIRKWGELYIPRVSLSFDQNEIIKIAEKNLTKFCEENVKGVFNIKQRLVVGDASDEIIKIIDEEKIDLVIMGTHGRKGLQHTLFGSVAENIVKQSPAPVLTINPYKI